MAIIKYAKILFLGMATGIIVAGLIIWGINSSPNFVKHIKSLWPQDLNSKIGNIINFSRNNKKVNYDLSPTNNPQCSVIKVPILMYHHIKINRKKYDSLQNSLSVSPENFEKQMAYLYNYGYQSISINGLAQAVKFHKSLPTRSYVISFDDGYRDIWENALPILQKYRAKAIVYIIVDNIGKPGYMKESDINDWLKAGMDIGSHTLSHPNLTRASFANKYSQICSSKQRLFDKFDTSISSFSYPSGKVNGEVEKMVEECGYSSAVTTLDGFVYQNSNLELLSRIRVRGTDSLERFIGNLPLPIKAN